jgi:hypothetical protein
MDFLDPKKLKRHNRMLFVGYLSIAVAIAGATLILLYQAYGFGIGQNGQVIQNGLIYLASQPNPANIYVNGKFKATTNTSFTLESGIYNFSIALQGYRTWSHKIEIDGGTIESYVYPLLIPNKLKTTKVKSYSGVPPLATESLNRQWFLVMNPGSDNSFDLYNLNNFNGTPLNIVLPSNIVTNPNGGSESWQVIGWANDNQHVLLNHLYNGTNEYILVNINHPANSVNLTQTFKNFQFTSLNFINEQYSQYYLYDANTLTLSKVSLNNPTIETPVLNNVLSWDSYLTNTILYVTPNKFQKGYVNVDELNNGQNFVIKTFEGGGNYLLDMAGYNGVDYVAAGSSLKSKVYIFKDPVGQINNDPTQKPVPIQVLFVKNPNYLSFSDNAQFIVAENGQQFGVFNIANQHGYNYIAKLPLQAPQLHATWMDGDRLTYVSGNKMVIFDYDHNYRQILEAASPNYIPAFDPNYHFIYNLEVSKTNPQIINLTSTSLLVS